MVLTALAGIALIAMLGLALDAGLAYVGRRTLQSGSDGAAEAGTQMLAYNFHQPAKLYTDTDIKNVVVSELTSSASLGSGGTGLSPYQGGTNSCDTTSTTVPTNLQATCAWYANQNGDLVLSASKHAVQVGGNTIPPLCPNTQPCAAGVAVVPYYTHATIFLQALGTKIAAEGSTATAIYAPITSSSTPGLADYAVAACAGPPPVHTPPVQRDQLIIRSQSWTNTFNGCGLINSQVSNTFKGYYHNPFDTTQTAGAPGSGVTLQPGSSIPNPAPAGGCNLTSPPVGGNCGLNSPGNPPCANPPPPAKNLCPNFTVGAAKITFKEEDYFKSDGGDDLGCSVTGECGNPNAIPLIHASWISCNPTPANGGQPPCHPLLIPVVDFFSGAGSNTFMHVAYFVAATPDKDWGDSSCGPSCGTSVDWTVTVVEQVATRGDWSGCTGGSCPGVGKDTPLSVGLRH
jgi:hypothetical protein